MSLGQHATFIWSAYAAVAVALGALIAWLVYDGRRHERRLAELEAQGIRRRSAAPDAPTAGPAGGAG